MKYSITIPASILESSINQALLKPSISRGDFFHEIRLSFKQNLENIFNTNGIKTLSEGTLGYINYTKNSIYKEFSPIKLDNTNEYRLDFNFCCRYGHDDYSLFAINYLNQNHYLPALSSLRNIFSIGNIIVLVENKDCDIELIMDEGLCSTGYAYHISKKKKKSYFCLFGIWFEPNLINSVVDSKLATYQETKEDLDEIRIGNISYPILYINRFSGVLYTCSCFNNYFDIYYDLKRFLPYDGEEKTLTNKINNLQIVDNICHYCNGGVPKYEYGSPMYYSTFLQKYLPYQELISRIKKLDILGDKDNARSVENELRLHFEYPQIGQQWVSETILFKIIKNLFSDFKVIHHYRGAELKGLELDIWIPELNLGIEYQGEQHFKAIKHWGGEEGLKKRIENDNKKKDLCKQFGYNLIEFTFTDEISEQAVLKKLEKFIKT